MALKFVDGFGHYGADGTQFSAINQTFNTGYIVGGGGSITFGAGFDATTKALYMTRSVSAAPYLERRFETTDDTVIIGFEFRANARFDGMLNIIGVTKIDWPSFMEIEGNAGAAIPILNTEYYVELKIVKSTKAYTMKLNGFPYITGVLTTANPIPDLLQIRWGFPTTGTTTQLVVSNIYLMDGSTGKYTDFIGPQRMRSDRPNTSIAPIEWQPTPTSKTNVQIMNNVPPLANEYTSSNMVGEADFYTSTTPVTGTVTAVAVTSVIGKTDIDSQVVKLGIGNSGDRLGGDDIDVPVQPSYLQQVFEKDQADNDWTSGTATSIPYGVTIQPRP